MIVVGIQLSKNTYVRICVLEKGQLIKAKRRVTKCLQQNLHNLLTSLSFKLNRTSNEKKPTKQNKTKQTKNTMCYQKSKGTVVTSRCHGSKNLDHNKPWSFKHGRKKNDMCEFWGNDCTHDQEQNGSPSAFCQWFENENDRQAVSRKIVEIQKFCFHGNVAFLLSLRKGSIRVRNQRKLTTCTEI